MHDYLQAILNNKQQELAALQQLIASDAQHPIHAIINGEQPRSSDKSFRAALNAEGLSVIAEIKRRSPSKAHLADITDPVALAQQYAAGGASAISVLTDEYGFNGSLQDLQNVSSALQATDVPILRKDFTLDALQIAEAVLHGADAVLLIVAVLKEQTAELIQAAKRMNIDALVEVHDQQELQLAIDSGAEIIGVNNRNLTTFDVDINNALTLRDDIPEGIVSVAESGLHQLEDINRCREASFSAVLIGEALVKSAQPEQFIRQIRQGAVI